MEIFDLSKENRFNITGEFTVDIKGEKQSYKLVAIHPNRTIVWKSDFDAVDTKTFQSSKLELAKNIWIGYNFDVSNHTKEDAESQEAELKISYPSRDISVGGLYLLKEDSFDTDLTVKWLKKEIPAEDENNEEEPEEPSDDEMKIIQGKFQWRDIETSLKGKDHQSILIGLKHPKFEKDVILLGSYIHEEMNRARVEVDFDYANDEDHHASFTSEIKNLSEDVGYKNYTIAMTGKHTASELNLIFDGSVGLKPNHYKIESTGTYKRGYLPDMDLVLDGFIDIDNKEIKFYVSFLVLMKYYDCQFHSYSERLQTKTSTSMASRQQSSQLIPSMALTLTVRTTNLKELWSWTLAKK